MRWTIGFALIVAGWLCLASEAGQRKAFGQAAVPKPTGTTQPGDGAAGESMPEWARPALEEARAELARVKPGRWSFIPHEDSPANHAIRDALEKNIPEVRFPGIKFEDALLFMRDLQRVGINPNWAAMEAAGITKTTEINLQLRDVTFEVALRELLTKAAGKDGLLDCMIINGKIAISTVEELSTRKYVLVFNIRDLLRPPTSDERFEIMTSRARRGLGTTQPAEPSPKQGIKDLLDLLRTSVLPDSWKPTGDCHMVESDGLLAVYQTPNGQRELSKLLNQIRERSRMQISVEFHAFSLRTGSLEKVLARAGLAQTQSAERVICWTDDVHVDRLLKELPPSVPASQPNAARLTLVNGREGRVAIEPPADAATPAAAVKVLVPLPLKVKAGGRDTERQVIDDAPTNPATHEAPPVVSPNAIPLNLRVTVTADRKYLIVTVEPEAQTGPGKEPPVPETNPPAGGLQRPETWATVMIPDRSTLLYKLPIPTDQRQSSKSDEDFLLVLIRSQILIPVGL